ncbi:MAG TPA: DUF3293 domain-containing protein [Gammaproteobacteria bacterium]|nr:DUF3293 domain-containing protein [Gammaproteobacteria bacterium]
MRNYRRARFDVLFGTETVTLCGRGVIVGDPLRVSESLAVVTAWNPGVSRPGRVANERANARLAEQLRSERRRWLPAVGRSADGEHREPSFAVLGISAEEARALAEQFGQAAAFHWDGRSGRLVWCRRKAVRQR